MSDEVKRYFLHIGMHDEDPEGNMVKHSAYAALESERDRLNDTLASSRAINPNFLSLKAENARLRVVVERLTAIIQANIDAMDELDIPEVQQQLTTLLSNTLKGLEDENKPIPKGNTPGD